MARTTEKHQSLLDSIYRILSEQLLTPAQVAVKVNCTEGSVRNMLRELEVNGIVSRVRSESFRNTGRGCTKLTWWAAINPHFTVVRKSRVYSLDDHSRIEINRAIAKSQNTRWLDSSGVSSYYANQTSFPDHAI